MIHHWKVFNWRSQILIITMIRHYQVKLYRLKSQTLKHVEIRNVSIKPIQETSLERF